MILCRRNQIACLFKATKGSKGDSYQVDEERSQERLQEGRYMYKEEKFE
jgi:hypothetical protein